MKKYLGLAALTLSLLTTPANASTTSVISSPVITKGKTSISARIGYSEAESSSSEDERLKSRIHIDHAFTDYYAARIVVSQDSPKGDSYEHDALRLENRFELFTADEYGFDLGTRLNYTFKDGDKGADALGLQFYERFTKDEWELLVAQIFSHQVGGGSTDGVSAQLWTQVTKPYDSNHRIGVEAFHNFGNLRNLNGYSKQSHTIGPVLKGALFGDYTYETAYRTGISKGAPDHTFKFVVNTKF